MTEAALGAGNIVWVDFDPDFGHDPAGRRPALIVSELAYNDSASFVLVCPITRNERPWPFKVRLPDESRVTGLVLVDQIKSVDKRRIVSRAIAELDAGFMARVRALLKPIFGMNDQQR